MFDTIVIGGGPAGFSAALYTARAKLNTLVLEKAYYGGQMAITNDMENYPGFEGMKGSVLADKMVSQAERFGARIVNEEVVEVSLEDKIKGVRTKENIFKSKTVILCMGASPRKLGLENEEKFTGSGVSYCATCDGAFFKDRTVAVIGGGNTAAEDVLYLSRFCSKVILVHRRSSMTATKVLQDAILGDPKVEIHWDSEVQSIKGEFKVEGMSVKNLKTGESSEIAADGIFIAIGNVPNTDLVKGKVNLNEYGYIITDEGMKTDKPGVYAAGDIREKKLRQVVTAASDGAVAADSAEKYLTGNKL